MVGRLGLNDISPVVATGTRPAAAVVGEHIPVSATVFREGHDAVAANVVLRGPNGAKIPFVRMTPGIPGTSRWDATVVFDAEGAWSFVVEAWGDPLSTWNHNVTVKIEAGQGAEDLANDLELGARIFDKLAKILQYGGRRRGAGGGNYYVEPGMSRSAVLIAVLVAPAVALAQGAVRAPTDSVTAPVRATGPGTSSSRGRSARSWPATRGPRPGRRATARSRTPPSTSTTWRAWASTSPTCHPSTRSAR